MKLFPPVRHSVSMRVISIAAPFLFPLSASAEVKSTFTVPPYTLGETVVGIEGWEMRNKDPYPVYTDPNAATIIDSPVVDATQSRTLELKTLLKNEGLGNLGDQFVMETQFAVVFNPNSSHEGGLYFRLASTDTTSPFHCGFYHGEGGGLYYKGEGERVILLPKEQIVQTTPYKVVIRVDRSAHSFRIVVTSGNDNAFRYESKEVAFQESFGVAPAKFKEFSMGNNKPTTVKAYIDYVKVTPLLK